MAILPEETSPQRRALFVGSVVSLSGAIIFVLSAATMIFLWVRLLFAAMGWIGILLGLCTSPIAVVYPFLLWFAHGDFPGLVFAMWLAGIAGLAVTMTWASYGRFRVLQPGPERRSGLSRTTVVTDEVD